ncbi:hypothetical protein ACRTEV_21640 [Rossellomorea arthrocnemi]
MSASTKLTLDDIVKMDIEERLLLTEKDYKHLNSTEKMQVKVLIQQANKAPSARDLMMNDKNASENTSENESGIENKSNSENNNENTFDIGSITKKIKKAQKKKPKFEETHSKANFWVRNDLNKALNEICTVRGEKTKIINEALQDYFVKRGNESK